MLLSHRSLTELLDDLMIKPPSFDLCLELHSMANRRLWDGGLLDGGGDEEGAAPQAKARSRRSVLNSRRRRLGAAASNESKQRTSFNVMRTQSKDAEPVGYV